MKAIASGDASGVKLGLAAIDSISREERAEFDGQLKHYLRNRSYEKALLFLNHSAEIPSGRCGGRKDFS